MKKVKYIWIFFRKSTLCLVYYWYFIFLFFVFFLWGIFSNMNVCNWCSLFICNGLKTSPNRLWWYSSTSKTKTFSKSFIRKCWPGGSCNISPQATMRRLPWYPGWRARAGSSTLPNCNACSRWALCYLYGYY